MLLYTYNPSIFAFSREGVLSTNISKPKFSLIGVPFDSSTTYKSGTRFGPIAIREASYNFENYNLELNKKLTVPLFDFGNLDVVHGNVRKTCDNLKETIYDLYQNEFTPITIGGEHSITLGVLEGINPYIDLSEVTILHLDAHMDMIDEYMGEKYSHATVMRRISELNPKKIIQFGVRSASYEEKKYADTNGISYFKVHEIKNSFENVKQIIDNINGPVYVTIDMDVYDPASAPSVGNPTPYGLSSWDMFKLMKAIYQKNIIGLDVVEVASTNFGDITSINAAKLIYDFLCMQSKY